MLVADSLQDHKHDEKSHQHDCSLKRCILHAVFRTDDSVTLHQYLRSEKELVRLGDGERFGQVKDFLKSIV